MEMKSEKLAFAWEKLASRGWFKKSSRLVQKQLAELGEDFCGYILYLGRLNDFKGNEIIKIKALVHSQKNTITTLITRSRLTNQEFEEEIIVPNTGNNPLNQGVIILTDKSGKATKIVWLKNSPIKMYFPDFSAAKALALPAKIEKSVKKYLDADNLEIGRYIDLGEVETEADFGSLPVHIFAITVKDSGKAKPETELTVAENGRTVEILKAQKDVFLAAILGKLLALKLIN